MVAGGGQGPVFCCDESKAMTKSRSDQSEPRPALALVGSLAAFFLGVTLLFAAWGKGLDPDGFATAMVRDQGVPPSLAGLAAVAIITVEFVLGAAMLAMIRRTSMLLPTTLLMGAFVLLAGWHYVYPIEDPSSCGCFGNLVEQTPGVHLAWNIGFFALASLAWIGRSSARVSFWRWLVPGFGLVFGAGLAVSAPMLPLDNLATRLAPGSELADLGLLEIAPQLDSGTHLVVLLDRSDEAMWTEVARLNENYALLGGSLIGFAEENEELAQQFFWDAGPAFEIYGAAYGALKPLYRTLPRTFLAKDGLVVDVWNGIPDDDVLGALVEGES